tara:strand:- start:101 stop:301 length:201 start_codon:yes stop_codon:yes gene_type:complete
MWQMPRVRSFLFVAIGFDRAKTEPEQRTMTTEQAQERLCGFNGCSFPWDHPTGGLTGGHEVRIHPQ